MEKYFFLIGWALFLGISATAQTPQEDFKRDVTLSGSNYVAYRGPQKKLTPAPKGYKPFYLSHYGRHGSRYMIGSAAYDVPVNELTKAEKAGMLTAKGKEVLEKAKLLREEARGRDGELTLLGTEQHKGIAKRMIQRFPEIFAGKTNVEARSTPVVRCILSMENALQQMLVMNPQINIFHDASEHDMYYMNLDDRKIETLKRSQEMGLAQKAFAAKHNNYKHVMSVLFKDQDWVAKHINQSDLNSKLFHMASSVQGTELRHQLSLYDIFNEDEIYDNWLMNNFWWHHAYSFDESTGNIQPYSQRNLLRNIIETADSCIALEHPGATLRYGHDTMVTPLTCLLNLNGYGETITDPEMIGKKWFDYKITPMATNIQFVFYRKNKTDKDVIFKVLLNEDEATLPLQRSDIAPYYHWNDFKDYFLKKLNDYKE